MDGAKPVRRLEDDEQAAWRAHRAASQPLAGHLDRRSQRDSGLPHAYFTVPVWLSEVPGCAMRMTEVAEGAEITRSRFSHAVTRLESDCWPRAGNTPPTGADSSPPSQPTCVPSPRAEPRRRPDPP